MKIPEYTDYEKVLQALPGNYKRKNRYIGGNILSLLTGMDKLGFCDRNGLLYDEGDYSDRWSISPKDSQYAWSFGFIENKARLGRNDRNDAFVVRPFFN